MTTSSRIDPQRAYLRQLNDALGHLVDPDEIQSIASRVLGEHLGVERVLYAEIVNDREAIIHRDYTDGVPSIAGVLDLSAFGKVALDTVGHGGTFVVSDIANDSRMPDRERAAYNDLGIFSLMGTGIVEGGEWIAVFGALHGTPRHWSDLDVSLMEETARRTSEAVRRWHVEAAFRRASERHRFLLELEDKLRPLGDPVAIRATAAQALGEHLEASRVGYAENQNDGTLLITTHHVDGVPPLEGRYPIDAYHRSRVGQPGDYHCIADIPVLSDLPDGEKQWYIDHQIIANLTLPLTKDGQLLGVLFVHQNVPRFWAESEISVAQAVVDRTWSASEQALAEKALRRSEERLRVTVEAARLGLWAGNFGSAEMEWSDTFRAIMGIAPDEPRTVRAVLKQIRPDDRAQVREALAAAADPTGAGVLEVEFRVLRDPDTVRWVGIRGQITFAEIDGERQAVRGVGVGRDITEGREAQLQAHASEERRQHLEREFVWNAAHELRTPLTGIIGSVEALNRGAVDDATQRDVFIGHLGREAARLTRLSDSLLELARAESADDLDTEPLAVAMVLDSIASDLETADGVTIGVDTRTFLSLDTHRGLFETAIGNLASNAAKYTQEGSIELRARQTPGAVVVEVADTGPGMDSEALDRVFDRFYRNADRAADGFGLGLSIARQAAVALGAELCLESAPGEGTLARLVFPRPEGCEEPR